MLTATQAKRIKIASFLNVNSNKNEFFIKSPFRDEKTPSFKINQAKNLWFDFGIGEGGTIIDLVCKLHNCGVSEALKVLSSGCFSFSPAKKNIEKKKESDNLINIKKIKELNNKALLDYLKSRKINIEIAKQYAKEVYYTVNDRHYFAVGVKNDSGGWEIRNKYTKMCLFSKNITTIDKNSTVVAIFEGFFDFLAALTYYKKIKIDNDIIILNSLSLLKKINLSKYNKINLFLDNDEAGKKAALSLQKKHQNIYNYSKMYNNYKDFNDFLIKSR